MPPAGASRVCSFCLARFPLRDLEQNGTSFECRDRAVCETRAARSGVYGQREDELEREAGR